MYQTISCQTISCNNMFDFLDVIAGLVARGLTFKSNATTLEIELLGGY